MSISRRQFILGTAAGLTPPFYGDKVPGFFQSYAGTTESQQLRISPPRWKEILRTPDNDYDAEVLKAGNQFFYRARGAILPITEHEARMIIKNPCLYYFSTALKLHNRINWQIEWQGRCHV